MIQLSSGKIVGGILFADDFVGVEPAEAYRCCTQLL